MSPEKPFKIHNLIRHSTLKIIRRAYGKNTVQYFILERVGGVSTFEIRDGGGGVVKSLLRNVWSNSEHTSMSYNRKQFNTMLYC